MTSKEIPVISEHPPPVGVLGLGAMGSGMARCLLAAEPSREVWVHTRRRSSAEALPEAGGRWAATAGELASQAEIVVVALPTLGDLEGLLDGADGILSSPERRLRSLILTSTCPADGVRHLAAKLAAHGIDLVDAPVSGGVEGARAGSLSVMVGHDGPLDDDVARVLDTLGRPVVLGPVGAGQIAKACNQMIVGATALALAEACVVASRSQIPLDRLLPLLAGGYAGSTLLSAKAEKLISGDYTPDGRAAYMLKDLRFAVSAAAESGTRTPLLDVALAEFEDLVDSGWGGDDLAVVRRHVEAGTRVGG